MDPVRMGRLFLFVGGVCLVLGCLLLLADKFPIIKNLGKLPGDIAIKRENFQFYFPLTTSILISMLLTLLFWLFRR